MRKTGEASLAFFYFNFREDQKGLRGLLSSFLVQLCHQSDSYCDILSEFHSNHAKGLRSPSEDALMGCLKKLLEFPGNAPVYLIMDALDDVSLHDESEQRRDIEKYIQSVIDTHRKSKKWKREKKQLVTKDLAEMAGGM